MTSVSFTFCKNHSSERQKSPLSQSGLILYRKCWTGSQVWQNLFLLRENADEVFFFQGKNPPHPFTYCQSHRHSLKLTFQLLWQRCQTHFIQRGPITVMKPAEGWKKYHWTISLSRRWHHQAGSNQKKAFPALVPIKKERKVSLFLFAGSYCLFLLYFADYLSLLHIPNVPLSQGLIPHSSWSRASGASSSSWALSHEQHGKKVRREKDAGIT